MVPCPWFRSFRRFRRFRESLRRFDPAIADPGGWIAATDTNSLRFDPAEADGHQIKKPRGSA